MSQHALQCFQFHLLCNKDYWVVVLLPFLPVLGLKGEETFYFGTTQ